MKPFGVFILLALVVTTVTLFVGAYIDCQNPQIVVLDGVVVDRTRVVEQREAVTIKRGCPICPGAAPKEETELVPETSYYVTVELMESGVMTRIRIKVNAELYEVLEVGMTVRVRLVRGARFGRECLPPELLLP